MFEPSEHLWQVWGLILNAISPPSYRLAGASPLPLDVGYLLNVTPAPHSHHSSTYHVARTSLPLDVVYLLTATPEPVVCGYKDTNYEKSLLQR